MSTVTIEAFLPAVEYVAPEYTEHDELCQLLSDMHKDTYGFRPRGYDWSKMTVEDLRAELKALEAPLAAAIEREQEEERFAIQKFEALVTKTMGHGAKTREKAIEWIVNGEYDLDYVCFNYGLPYGYLNKKVA